MNHKTSYKKKWIIRYYKNMLLVTTDQKQMNQMNIFYNYIQIILISSSSQL